MEENKKNENKQERVNENAPREKKQPVKKGVSVPVVVVIVIAVIAIGVAAGYFIGRGVLTKSGNTAGGSIEVSGVEAVSVVGEPGEVDDDVFTQELNGENDSGLEALSGEDSTQDTTAALQGDDEFETVGMDVAEDDTTVVAEYDGGKIYRGEAAEEYNSALAAYLFAGYSEEDVSEQLVQDTLKQMILDRITAAKATEMGLDQLTDEEKQTAEQTATTDYAEQVSFYTDFVREDGMTDTEVEKAAEEFLEEYEGINYDSVYKETVSEVVADKLYDELTKDVTVTEDDVKSAYDDALALQQTTFTDSAEDYELSQLSGEVIVYNLSGYRAIGIINIYIDDDTLLYMMELEDELSGLDETKDADRIAEINDQLAACYGECEAKAEEALAEIKGGADFNDVYKKYSGDLEFTDENLVKSGYYISADSTMYDEDVIKAAMALSKPGDVSEVILNTNGACILKYIGDVTPGDVPYEDVHDALQAQTLEVAKLSAYDAKCDEWVNAVNPVYYTDRMY